MAEKNREVGIRLSVKDAELAKRALEAFGKDGQAAIKRIEASAKPASVSLHALNAATSGAKTSFVAFAGGLTAGLAPLLTAAGLINGARAALQKFGDIADMSKSAGIDSEYFQGIAHTARLAGIEIGTTAGALETYAKNAGDAAVGRGRMVTALKLLNPELLKNIQLATTQEQRIRLAADALERANSVAEKSALSGTLFGNSDFWKALEGGAATLDATIDRARELGVIVDREVIAKADDLGDAFDTATEIIDNRFKEALINLAPGLANFAGWVATISGNIRDFVDSFKSIEELSTSGLDKRLTDLARQDLELERRELEMKGRLQNPGLFSWLDPKAELAKLAEQRAKNHAEQQAVLKEWGGRRSPPSTSTGGGGMPPELPPSDEAKQAIKEAEALIRRLRTESEVYADTVDDLKEKLDAGLITQETFNRGVAEAALKFAKAADDSDEYAEALARLDQAKLAGIITEKQYTDAVESLTKRRLVAQNDWIAGVQLGLMQIQDGAKDVTTDVARAVTGWADSLGEQIGQVFRTGKFAWQDLVKTMLADIAKLATQQMITRPLGNLLSGLMGGLMGGGGLTPQPVTNIGFGSYGSFDTGGWTGDGDPSQPAGVVHRKEFVVKSGPAARYRDLLEAMNSGRGIGGGGMTLAPTYNINGSGLSAGQLLAVLDQHDRQLLEKVSGVVKRDMGRGVFG